jgi:hypothetical protein
MPVRSEDFELPLDLHLSKERLFGAGLDTCSPA